MSSKSSANLKKQNEIIEFHKAHPGLSKLILAKQSISNKISGKNPKAEMEKKKLEESKMYNAVDKILLKQTPLKQSEAEYLTNFLSNKTINKLNQEAKVTNKIREYFQSNVLVKSKSISNLSKRSKSSLKLPRISSSRGKFLGSKESLFKFSK
jgi:hypothetical protein